MKGFPRGNLAGWIGGLVVLFLSLPAWPLSVTPGRTEVRIIPGNKTETYLTVVNDAKEDMNVGLETKDWFILEANKANHLTVDTWLTVLGAKEFVLKPGKSRKIPIAVSCPKNAQGELVGMVSFVYQTHPPSMVTPVISVSVYLTAQGTEKTAGEIGDLVVRRLPQAVQAIATVKNTGNVHLRPSGVVLLVDDQGRQVDGLPIREGGPAYPGRDSPYGTYDMTLKLKPGHYLAKATLTSDGYSMVSERGFTVPGDGTQFKMDEKGAGR